MSITIHGREESDDADIIPAYLNDWSNLLQKSTKEDFNLSLIDVTITPRGHLLLVHLLNQSLPRKHSHNGEDSEKWNMVFLDRCRFEAETSDVSETTNNDPNYYTPERMLIFTTTLMTRARVLVLRGGDCSEVISCLTTNPQLDEMELQSLMIDDQTSWQADVYAGLGDMIQRSIHLKNVLLYLRFDKAPNEMFESLANAIWIQDLTFMEPDHLAEQDREQMLSKLVGGGGHIGVVVRLLQNPQSQLQQLHLSRLKLENNHFIPIVHLLSTSHLKFLDVSANRIQCRGILELAQQLPRIQSLKNILIGGNPWLSSAQVEECAVALVQGVMQNYSLEYLDSHLCGNSSCDLDSFPQAFLLMHFLDINRAGRRILAVSTEIWLGLWPLILERTSLLFADCYNNSLAGQRRTRQANAVYFLLRNCPILCLATYSPSRNTRNVE